MNKIIITILSVFLIFTLAINIIRNNDEDPVTMQDIVEALGELDIDFNNTINTIVTIGNNLSNAFEEGEEVTTSILNVLKAIYNMITLPFALIVDIVETITSVVTAIYGLLAIEVPE